MKQALATSTLVTITDDNRIKSNIKAGGRSTIILREIPSEASEEEIREIFNFDGCKSVVSMHSEIGDTWYVRIGSFSDAFICIN